MNREKLLSVAMIAEHIAEMARKCAEHGSVDHLDAFIKKLDVCVSAGSLLANDIAINAGVCNNTIGGAVMGIMALRDSINGRSNL